MVNKYERQSGEDTVGFRGTRAARGALCEVGECILHIKVSDL